MLEIKRPILKFLSDNLKVHCVLIRSHVRAMVVQNIYQELAVALAACNASTWMALI